MSNPETICVSLETAKRLYEAEYDQNTVFVWCERWEDGLTVHEIELNEICYYGGCLEKYPAPTASEMLDCLPKNLFTDSVIDAGEMVGLMSNGHIKLSAIPCQNNKALYCISYGVQKSGEYAGIDEITIEWIRDECFVEVLSQMWLHLKEKGLI